MARIIDGNETNMIGVNVAKRRRQLKMSQQELSNRLELYGVYVCRGSISRIESLTRTVTDIELYTLSRVLDIAVDELLDKSVVDDK